ncbi:glycosyltransferase family 2 protein [uncultured Oscillibacter sp.]|uniref:glycosyltransferase family 2 protein n=1 Tax=uncultured Oscillibacter sp. TaxID=876091 RepID=UPI00261BCC12|nr:glycosyltransferase family 2 protein [uncultured Oscillibacter sp.]
MDTAGKVSICVPVYNTGNYLARCIESLRSQSYPDLEIILTDDGSTDGSGAVCDRYAALDPRITVIHQPNGGEASARNAALSAASGEYVMFCDSDDEYLPDAVRLLAGAALAENAGLVLGGYLERTGDTERFATGHLRRYSPRTLAQEQLDGQCPYGIGYIASTVNGKLFRRELLREHAIRFDERFVIGNDSVLMCEYLQYAERICDVFAPVYVYYKFDPAERQQGMSFVYPDAVFHSAYVAGGLLELARPDQSRREQLVTERYRAFAAGCVYASANREHLPRGGLLPYLEAFCREGTLPWEGAELCLKGACASRGAEAAAVRRFSRLLVRRDYRGAERLLGLLGRVKRVRPYEEGARVRRMIRLEGERQA